jgi:SPP1 family predicted phage head-tail adaptor
MTIQGQRYRHRVTFQEPREEQDSESGAVTINWVTMPGMSSVPAEVLTGPGREFRESGTGQAETTARINCRWFAVDRVTLYRWRILWDGRIYNIGSAETDKTGRREWRLRCKDGVSDGQ